jgi:hypothetical protein
MKIVDKVGSSPAETQSLLVLLDGLYSLQSLRLGYKTVLLVAGQLYLSLQLKFHCAGCLQAMKGTSVCILCSYILFTSQSLTRNRSISAYIL